MCERIHNIPLTLEDIFGFWRANEAWNPKWQQVATDKGFDSWETWRRKFLEQLAASTDTEWALEWLEKPLEAVVDWYGGSFPAWREHVYGGKSTMVFSEIVQQSFVTAHDTVRDLVGHFPKSTILSVAEDETGRTVVVEGMHRVCALALLARAGRSHSGLVFVARGRMKPGTRLSFDTRPEHTRDGIGFK